jgi:hypothetical protein
MYIETLRIRLSQGARMKCGKISFLLRRFLVDIWAYLGFLVFYFVAYRDVLSQQTLFLALNIAPLPTSNSRFYIPGQFYWYPGNLGSLAQSHLAPWLSYILVQLTGNNLVLAEKFLASATLVSCFTMYFFLSKHFKGSRIANFSAALIYGFGPATVLNFADVLNWGFAMLPLVFYFILNLLEGKRKITDILLLGLTLTILSAFLPQLLLFILVSFTVLTTIRTITLVEKIKYLKSVIFSFSLSIIVFILTSPYLLSGAYRLMTIIGWVSSNVFSQSNLPSFFQPGLYFNTYANQEIANTIRLIGGSPGNSLPENSWIGFVLPLIAFASLLLVRRGKKLLNLLAFSLISLIIITIIYGIHLKTNWALWLLYNTPINLIYYPERILYIVAFVYSVLISASITELINRLGGSFSATVSRHFHFVSHRHLKTIFSIILVLIILISVFSFAPAFDQKIHEERFQPLPTFYADIQNWLNTKNNSENYRVMFLPTDSFSSILGTPDVFECTPGYAFPETNDYVNFVYDQFVTDETHNLGSLLAFASVKYIILTNSTSDVLTFDLTGQVRFTEGLVYGNSTMLQKLLEDQTDLRLIHDAGDFRVYENIMYMPKISVFSNATYIVGSDAALAAIQNLPDFNVDNNMLIFANQNPILAKELSDISSSVLFFNSDLTNYAHLLDSSLVTTANEISDKGQVYLFSLNSSSFSLPITLPTGQWRLAIKFLESSKENPIVDGMTLSKAHISEINNWSVFDPITFASGTHNIKILTGADGGYLALYNTENLSDIFSNNSIKSTSSKNSETSYNLNVDADFPLFVSLSESYYPNWVAQSDSQNLIHFYAFSYSNGFYLNTTGSKTINIEYNPPLLNQIYVSQQFLFVTIALFLITITIIKTIRTFTKRLKKGKVYNPNG